MAAVNPREISMELAFDFLIEIYNLESKIKRIPIVKREMI